nr:hypothetical protein [Tanacetum cinerariifolium]
PQRNAAHGRVFPEQRKHALVFGQLHRVAEAVYVKLGGVERQVGSRQDGQVGLDGGRGRAS